MICVGFSRGAFTMSAYVEYVEYAEEDEVGACVYVGAPGENYDCTEKAVMYSIKKYEGPGIDV